jgi:hypothetical protein
MLFLVTSFYWLSVYNTRILEQKSAKLIFVFMIMFYTSGIFRAGIDHMEYNRYINALTEDLRNTYPEKIFIIDEQLIPYRFSKINMNVEYETLIKSNLHLGESEVLFITPHAKAFEVDGEFPVFINSISSLENSKEVILQTDFDPTHMVNTSSDKQLKHYKYFNPKSYFVYCNESYFKFKNHDHRILDGNYMAAFNQKYGFVISDYYGPL